MGNRAVATFDVDQVVPPRKHCQLCGVGRVPHFLSKFYDVPTWVHPDFDLLSQEFLTKPEKEGLRLSAPAVSALPAPPPKEAKGAPSGALSSVAPVSLEVAAFKVYPWQE